MSNFVIVAFYIYKDDFILLLIITIEISEITIHETNIGMYPKCFMMIPYALDDRPAPRYVEKSSIPLTDAVLPVSE